MRTELDRIILTAAFAAVAVIGVLVLVNSYFPLADAKQQRKDANGNSTAAASTRGHTQQGRQDARKGAGHAAQGVHGPAPPRWLSANPDKAWTEAFFLKYRCVRACVHACRGVPAWRRCMQRHDARRMWLPCACFCWSMCAVVALPSHCAGIVRAVRAAACRVLAQRA